MERCQLLGEVISAGDGQIVGRVRLQKVFYLLDQLGLESGFSYSYHHYGPYTSDLANAVADAKAFKLVSESTKHRATDGVGFSVYSLGDDFAPTDQRLGRLEKNEAARIMKKLQNYSATVLELAATIHWLINVEKVSDWETELHRRKGMKTQRGRMEQAVELLQSLTLH